MHIYIWQKVHLDFDEAITLTRLTPPALDVKGKTPRLIPARRRFGQAGKPVADGGKGPGIGRRVGSRGAANGRLVDVDYLVEMFQPAQAVMRARHQPRTVQRARCRRLQCVDNQARLARTRNPGDAGEGAERDRRGDILQIVRARAVQRQFLAIALAAFLRDGDFYFRFLTYR